MQSPDANDHAGQPEEAFDARINELIAKRKLQQDALAKIKASIERDTPGQKPSGKRPESNSK
jgi:hypothetical protein